MNDTQKSLFVNTIEHIENVASAAREIDLVFKKYYLDANERPGGAIADYDLEHYATQLLAEMFDNSNDCLEWIEWYLYEVSEGWSDGLVGWMDNEGEEREMYINTPQALLDFLLNDLNDYLDSDI